MKKLAIVLTHPIQYNAPIFKLISERGVIDLKVFYTWEQAQEKVYDIDFKREIKWDVPLLEGYAHVFVKNISKTPGLHHFKGIDNPTLIKDIEAYNPDAILIYGWNFKSHLKALKYFKNRIPVSFRGDSTTLDDLPGIKSILRKVFLSWVYRHVDVAFFVGKRNKDYFLNNGLHSSQLLYAPHAIDNERFGGKGSDTILRDAAALRERLGIKENEIVFLFAGKFEPKKNPKLLISAFKKLKLQQVHLVMVGNGVLENNLKNMCTGNSNIHFLEFQNQLAMPSVYGIADVFVLPSAGPGETWGLAVNEAMACGKVVIVSDKCGCAVDLVENGVNGFIFESENENDLLNKLQACSDKPLDELKYMGIASCNKIQKWSFRTVCEQIEFFVNDVVR